MKKAKRIIGLLCAFVLCFSSVGYASAEGIATKNVMEKEETVSEIDLSIETDKEEYALGELIKVKVNAQNNSNAKMENLELEAVCPEGLLVLKDNLKYSQPVLEAGKSASYTFELTSEKKTVVDEEDKDTSDKDNSTGKNDKEENEAVKTGDGGFTNIVILLGVSLAVILVLTSKKYKKMFFMLMLVASMCMLQSNNVEAASDAVGKASAEKTITVDGKEYVLKVNGVYTYEKDDSGDIEKEITLDQKDFTTINIKETLSGKYPTDVNIVDTYYKVENSKGTEQFTNVVYKDGKFEIKDILLAPEDNKITVVMQDDKGNMYGATVNVFFDRGFSYELQEDHVVLTDGKNGYVDNVILVYLDKDATEGDEKELLQQLDGKIVGRTNAVKVLVVEIEARTESELKKICKQAEKNKYVKGALINRVHQYENEEEINENVPEILGYKKGEKNTDNQYGSDWWAKTINLEEARIYNDKFRHMVVGVIDNGFDTEHMDLNIEVLNSEDNRKSKHGTHVAGIIGSARTGIIPEAKMLGINNITMNRILKIDDATLLDDACQLVSNGAKVINLSQGTEIGKTEEEQYVEARNSITIIECIRQEITDDFIFIQGAGNDGDDSSTVGRFASVNRTYIEKARNENPNLISEDAVDVDMDHFLIVGGAEKNTNGYKLFAGPGGLIAKDCASNYGEKIDVVAPGKKIYSTLPNNDYGYMTGTSMSAPIVSGVTAMTWAVNPGLSAGEVKSIICETASEGVKSNQKPEVDNRTYKMVNAAAAVEKSLGILGKVSGRVVDENGEPVIDAKVSTDVYNTETYEDGRFVLNSQVGQKIVYIEKEGYERVALNVKINKNVTTIIPQDIILKKVAEPGYFTCTVYSNEDKLPLGGVTVNLYDEDKLVSSGESLQDGKVKIELNKSVDKIELILKGFKTKTIDLLLSENNGNIDWGDVYLDIDDGQDKPEEGIKIASGECGYKVIWTLYDNGTMYISGEGTMDYFDSVEDVPWRKYIKNISKVIVGNGVAEIEQYAFAECENLQTVICSDSVAKIGQCAFLECTSLKNIKFSQKLIEIGWLAFGECISLETILLPASLEKIDGNAFWSCVKLQDVVIPNGVTKIEECAFADCTGLKSIKLPDNITEISNQIFYNCTSLESITIPESVTRIWRRAFSGCVKLQNIMIPGKVEHIEEYAFSGCVELESIELPDSVTCLGMYCFEDCINLKKVVLSHQITRISTATFIGCENLQEIELPDSVKYIEDSVFSGCKNLKTIELPDGVEHLEGGVFYDCVNLEEIVIPDNIIDIGDGMFINCIKLQNVVLPKNLETIGERAFYNCKGLQTVTLPTKLTTIGDYAFYSCENLQEIELPEGLLNIGGCVFYDCTSLREITIPKSVISIGNDLVNKNNIYPTIYVYSGSYAQTYVVEKRYYRHVVI